MQQLPHRFREKSCRRYESTIAAILKSYPEPFRIVTQVGGLSICTISNRLRDAIRSWQTYKWPTTQFDLDFLLSQSIKVSETVDCVTASFRSTDVLTPILTEAPGNVVRLAKSPALSHHVIPDEELEATIKLAETGCLNNPVFVKLTEAKAEELELAHDIALVKQADGLYKLT